MLTGELNQTKSGYTLREDSMNTVWNLLCLAGNIILLLINMWYILTIFIARVALPIIIGILAIVILGKDKGGIS
jgi:hypothetical protein